MPHLPSLDVLDDLKRLALNPYWLTNAELRALLERAIEEIEVLRMVDREVNAEPEGRA